MQRAARHIFAFTAIVASGWFIMARIGLESMLRTEAEGVHIFDIPKHPGILGAAYVIGALLLPVLAVWAMAPPPVDTRVKTYALRLIGAYFGAGVVTFLLFLWVLWNI